MRKHRDSTRLLLLSLVLAVGAVVVIAETEDPPRDVAADAPGSVPAPRVQLGGLDRVEGRHGVGA